jgi:glycerophosphoryl diester phosphodiesterase
MELLRQARPLLIGHRGAAALAPENTLESIETAARHGVDAVEIDVFHGPDGKLVLAHGPDVPQGAVALDDALALVARLGIAVQLDVKIEGAAQAISDAVDGAGLADRAFASSFSLTALAELAAAAPELPRSYTYPEDRLGLSSRPWLRPLRSPGLAALRAALPHRLPGWLRSVDAAAATLNWAVMSPAAVDACHRLGCAVYVWTVNDPALAESLVEMGADAIITDDPRIAPGGTPEA